MMLQIRIVAVGKLKESYTQEGVAFFLRHINRNCQASIVEIQEERVSESAGSSDIQNAVDRETTRIAEALRPEEAVVLLDIDGEMLDSKQLKRKINSLTDRGRIPIAFIIGGSYGVNAKFLPSKTFSFSFSKMTFPHQLVRLILLEQLYLMVK
jgi:23S rRNA (pseudouridine1915-N3)-methyltransferase